jgi:hypothetical protein
LAGTTAENVARRRQNKNNYYGTPKRQQIILIDASDPAS